MDAKIKKYLLAAARRIHRWHSERQAARKRAFVDSKGTILKCEKCGVQHTRKSRKIELDHTVPVIPLTGFDSWDSVYERMFCSRDLLKNLCKECHGVKTKGENAKRERKKRKT